MSNKNLDGNDWIGSAATAFGTAGPIIGFILGTILGLQRAAKLEAEEKAAQQIVPVVETRK